LHAAKGLPDSCWASLCADLLLLLHARAATKPAKAPLHAMKSLLLHHLLTLQYAERYISQEFHRS
jgi:hypothetical protein